jgi:galactokinase
LAYSKSEFHISVPGRVNLIGEHIDYHSLPVLPMAIQRRISISYKPSHSGFVCASSERYGACKVDFADLAPSPAGEWSNYIKAAIQAINTRWKLLHGIEATVTSDLPAAAGLSSSSALLTGFTIALLRANGIEPTIGELMEILPDGEHYVGTRGGGMDHAAVLACQSANALLVEFAPLALSAVPIPDNWGFIVAHSLTTAEKSGGVREEYNARRTAGLTALLKLGLPSYRAAVENYSQAKLAALNSFPTLADPERRTFRHVISEAFRVREAATALRNADHGSFGRLLNESHASLRNDLRVSVSALDELVEAAMKAGAYGARLTGAGFGGCAIIFSEMSAREKIADSLIDNFYSQRAGFEASKHLIFAEPSAGALS